MTTRQREEILCAAIKVTDSMFMWGFSPNRHSDILLDMKKIGLPAKGTVQGFYTSEWRFVDRNEAYKIADDAGQIISKEREDHIPGMLYSEDLW